MNKLRYIAFFILILLPAVIAAQGHGRGFNPDSLSQITVSGIVRVDSAGMMNSLYFLNTNNDSIPDYKLIFGPHWYQPDSSNAVRPKNGDSITVTGGLADTNSITTKTIVVYNINGEFWRDPYNPFWQIVHGGKNPNKGCRGFAYGHIPDSVQSVSLSGKALVDTTFYFDQYFLDVNNDSTPDYFLNFGPPWFTPQSGVTKPNEGDSISITGILVRSKDSIKSVVVFTLNGQAWRDSTHFDTQFGGRWMSKNQNDSLKFYAPFDSLDWGEMGPGWHPGGMHGGMMLPDSLFARIVEIFPGSVPDAKGQNIFAAYEIGMFLPSGMNAMWMGGGCGRHLKIKNNMKFHLHFDNSQAAGFNINGNNLKVKAWDEQSNSWKDISNSTVDLANNTITFSTSDVGNFIALTAAQPTGVNEVSKNIPNNYELLQNYPNPFNPTTSIHFKLKENTHVSLVVYNALGQQINTLINKDMNAGGYSVTFDASNLPSGIYFYQLNAGENRLVKKMLLLK